MPKVQKMHHRLAVTLPSIVDCSARYGSMPLAEIRFGELLWDSPRAWRFEYQAVYADGMVDSRLYGRAMSGATRREAMVRWQKLEAGFGVVTLLLYHLRPPQTRGQIEMRDRMNRQLEMGRQSWIAEPISTGRAA